jgi:hypothetical protein
MQKESRKNNRLSSYCSRRKENNKESEDKEAKNFFNNKD